MKKILFFILLFSFSSICFAQRHIELKTYYPSPYGSYKEMDIEEGIIFGTHDSPSDYVADITCNASKRGKLAFGLKDSSVTGERRYYYCDSIGGVWDWYEENSAGVETTETGVGSSVMYLMSTGSYRNCPSDWLSAGMSHYYNGDIGANVDERVCYRSDAACLVITFLAGSIPSCPSGWDKTFSGSMSGGAGGGASVYQTTCYKCP